MRKLGFTAIGGLLLGSVVACSGGHGNGVGPTPGVGGSGATAGSAGAGGSGATASGPDSSFEDPAADAPPLDLPSDITQRAKSIVGTTTMADAVQATEEALAAGGVSTQHDGSVVTPGSAPVASAWVESAYLADMALEARDRATAATMTATELGQMLAQFGLPVLAGKTAAESFMTLLAAWTKEALANPADPASFAILFIAANNQLQSPRANLSLETQDPDLVRFSLLDLELLSAAFDRSVIMPTPMGADTGPCAGLKSSFGMWDSVAKVTGSEVTSEAMKSFVQSVYGDLLGPDVGSNFSKVLSSLKIGTKLWKFVEFFRYGTLYVSIDTENPTHKPLPSGAQKFGTVTAHAGVDQQVYDDYVNWLGKQGVQAINDINACFSYMGLPTKTDITDVAKDAGNWRVSWDIVKGAGSQVLFKQGQQFDIYSRLENQLTSVSPTEAKDSVEFEIMPQLADVSQGTERKRHAVFSAQLRRGKPPELGNLWGSGKAGYKATGSAGWENFSSVMGVVGSLVDVTGNWALEVASPRRYATQELIEIEPKGWVGTIVLSEQGSGSEDQHFGTSVNDESWTGWSGSIKYETRMELGGSAPLAPGVEATDSAIGVSTAQCQIKVDSGSLSSYCYEGCPSAIPPGPPEVDIIRTTGIWGQSVKIGDSAMVVLTAYPHEIYDQAAAYLPPEMKAKIGTYEIMIMPSGCGDEKALSSHYTSTTDQTGSTYTTTESYDMAQIPVSQAWSGPYPPAGDNQLIFKGNLDANDPHKISIDVSLPRKQTIPTTSYTVDTILHLKADLRRQD